MSERLHRLREDMADAVGNAIIKFRKEKDYDFIGIIVFSAMTKLFVDMAAANKSPIELIDAALKQGSIIGEEYTDVALKAYRLSKDKTEST